MSEKGSSKQPQRPIQIISLLGPPGSGKETQCNLLAQRLQLEHLNIGDLLRKELDREGSVHGDVIKQNMTAGTAGSSEIITAVLQARVEDSISRGVEAVVLDGFPRNIHQMEDFERTVGSIDHIYVLECPVDVCVGRLLPRARLDDKLDNINARFATYRAKTGTVIKLFEERNTVTLLDATKPLAEVSQELEGYVSKFVGKS